jgi:hypothetical protein
MRPIKDFDQLIDRLKRGLLSALVRDMYIDFKLSKDTQDHPNKSEEGNGEQGEKGEKMGRDEHDKKGNMKTSEGIENSRQQKKGVSEKEKGRKGEKG